jgi:integrase
VSEALTLRWADIDDVNGELAFKSLQQRREPDMRRVPAPSALIELFGRLQASRLGDLPASRIWTWSRITAWRRVRRVFEAAGITGASAFPQALRISFAQQALEAGVPVAMVCRWLGVAALQTAWLAERQFDGCGSHWAQCIWDGIPKPSPVEQPPMSETTKDWRT